MREVPDEELYPSLLDRLADTVRMVERATLKWRHDAIEAHGFTVEKLRPLLLAAGVRSIEPERDRSSEGERFETVSAGPRIRDLLRTRLPARKPNVRVPLSDLVEISDVARLPADSGSGPAATRSSRDLRASVVQNLGWLLNTIQLMDDEELSDSPEVRGSVLNFGIPVIAGNTRSSVSIQDVSDGIRAAVERFEPRLSEISVTSLEVGDRSAGTVVGFKIEGRLWGPQNSERFGARTSLDLETGRFDVKRDVR